MDLCARVHEERGHREGVELEFTCLMEVGP
jgi:hypothetical protein